MHGCNPPTGGGGGGVKIALKRLLHKLFWHPKEAYIFQNGKPGWFAMCEDCATPIVREFIRRSK